jgi:excisionase family DNA binding protein
MEKLLLTVREAADVLSVSRSRVYELIHAEQLDSVKIGRSRRVSLASVRRFVEGPSAFVPLPDAVVEALKLRREQQETDRLAAGTEFWEDWGLVFTTRFGTPLSPSNDYRDFQRLIAAGLRHVRLHDLRHTAASLMLAQE